MSEFFANFGTIFGFFLRIFVCAVLTIVITGIYLAAGEILVKIAKFSVKKGPWIGILICLGWFIVFSLFVSVMGATIMSIHIEGVDVVGATVIGFLLSVGSILLTVIPWMKTFQAIKQAVQKAPKVH